jgi:hypothetical protein
VLCREFSYFCLAYTWFSQACDYALLRFCIQAVLRGQAGNQGFRVYGSKVRRFG